MAQSFRVIAHQGPPAKRAYRLRKRPDHEAPDFRAAAISASGPAYRLSRRRAEEIVADLAVAAADLSAQLGF